MRHRRRQQLQQLQEQRLQNPILASLASIAREGSPAAMEQQTTKLRRRTRSTIPSSSGPQKLDGEVDGALAATAAAEAVGVGTVVGVGMDSDEALANEAACTTSVR
jgi:hypothetical protein